MPVSMLLLIAEYSTLPGYNFLFHLAIHYVPGHKLGFSLSIGFSRKLGYPPADLDGFPHLFFHAVKFEGFEIQIKVCVCVCVLKIAHVCIYIYIYIYRYIYIYIHTHTHI